MQMANKHIKCCSTSLRKCKSKLQCGGDLQDGGGVRCGDRLSPQIHQKYIYMWNNSYRTPTEHWQKTSDFPKGKKLPTYLGKAKEKRKNRDNRIGTRPAPLKGAVKEEKFPHTRKPLH